MKLIIGLGNPGEDYARTRHNAGYLVVDRLATRHGFGIAKYKFHSGLFDGSIADQRCALLQPATYMNRSGIAVAQAMAFYKLSPDDLMIVVDDLALPCGRIRMRPDGGDGGHNGLADIEAKLRTNNYPRLRIGIDGPASMCQHDYVLGRFNAQQLAALDPALDHACDAIECWLEEGIEKAMSLFNAGG